MEIASEGTITESIVDEAVFDSHTGNCPDITHVGGSVYAIAYAGRNEDGWLKTMTIATDGTITDEIIDSLEFDNQVGYYPDIFPIAGDVFAIAYTGTSHWYGVLKTIEIATTATVDAAAAYRVSATAGDTVINAFVNIAGDIISVVSWQVQ